MKIRLDAALVSRGIATSKERAKAFIMAGDVYVDDQKADKAGQMVDENADIEYRGEVMRYVSRGGYKLERAVESFALDLSGKRCIDVGASTGGFTDCMLQNGAASVLAVDVGYGQFAWSLRSDPRVTVLERTNIRYATPEQTGDPFDFAAIDVSFISLTLVLPVVHTLMATGGQIVALIKPQFEAGRDKVGKHGVVKDPQTHLEVLRKINNFTAENGLHPLACDVSPIKGPKGNIEYLMLFANETGSPLPDDLLAQVVDGAHKGESISSS